MDWESAMQRLRVVGSSHLDSGQPRSLQSVEPTFNYVARKIDGSGTNGQLRAQTGSDRTQPPILLSSNFSFCLREQLDSVASSMRLA